ncbi:hypothetical protein GM415_00560 [Pseudodesulfovibrio cashew]|uniref:Histidine kinase n=1 Tax=Pseudodesulfovibrio cashew TaxID=2678688 RepID=A0A6I6JE37_9BACT|nr:hypothetical protein [Pseudodesulfovibrio cashew]QGY38692.1 hypothetical protein GM415_00560 [Pseudodesulfovibrio cashew]
MGRLKGPMLSLLWVAMLAGAAVYLVDPGGPPEPPAGWKVWRDIGGIRALAPFGDGVYAGGLVGLFRLDDNGGAALVEIPGQESNLLVNALLDDGSGRLWVAHAGGLSVLEGKRWRSFTMEEGLPGVFATGLCREPGGAVWASFYGGLARLPAGWNGDPSAVRRFTSRDGLPHDKVQVVALDQAGNVWAGSYAAPMGGVARFDGSRWQVWNGRDGLPHPNVTSILAVSAREVWVGFGYFQEGGAARFGSDGGEWRLAETVPAALLAGPKVRSLFRDDAGRLWLGHEYDGITVLEDGAAVRRLTMDDGLPAREVMTMRRERSGGMWLGTLGGVVRIGPEAVERLFADDVTGSSP